MSARTDIRDALVTLLEGIDGVRKVSTGPYQDFHQVPTARMPYIQLISSTENRDLLDVHRKSECIWTIDLWCYLDAKEDVEAWVEKIRAQIVTNRGLSLPGVVTDVFIRTIITDDVGWVSPDGFILMEIEVTYRVLD